MQLDKYACSILLFPHFYFEDESEKRTPVVHFLHSKEADTQRRDMKHRCTSTNETFKAKGGGRGKEDAAVERERGSVSWVPLTTCIGLHPSRHTVAVPARD